MTFQFVPAKRENVWLLLGVVGGTGSGKTMSALRIARGIAGGQPFAGIDTENGRMNHYADLFAELHVAQIGAPFRPQKYTDAIEAGEKYLAAQNIPSHQRVILVDSASHEWYGDGGCLDWHDELMGGSQAKNLSAWIEPKKSHKRMVTRLLQVNAHVILCFRAEPKVEAIKENGQTKIVAKKSLTGLDGWIPISEKNLPYELTASFLLMADRPGVPKPIKLQEQHKPFVSLDHPLDEDTGKRLAAWAAGGAKPQASTAAPAAAPAPEVAQEPADDSDFDMGDTASTNGDTPRPMTVDEFKTACAAAFIPPPAQKEAGKRLFPGRTAASLTDDERGQWFAELTKTVPVEA